MVTLNNILENEESRKLVKAFEKITEDLDVKTSGQSKFAELNDYIVELTSYKKGIELIFLNKEDPKKYAGIYAGEFGGEYTIQLNIRGLDISSESDSEVIERIYKIYKEIK